MAGLPFTVASDLVNHMFRNTPLTARFPIYAALLEGDPGDALGTWPEQDGDQYSRKQITIGAPSNGLASNSNEVTWTAGNAWADPCTHVALMGNRPSAGASTDCYMFGALDAPILVGAGETIRFQSGDLVINFKATAA